MRTHQSAYRYSIPLDYKVQRVDNDAELFEDLHHIDTKLSGGGALFSPQGKVFVGGLTHYTTDRSLRNYFEQYGDVLNAEVLRDHQTLNSRGFGFVTFMSDQVATHVISFGSARPHVIDGKQVEVKIAVPKAKEGREGSETRNGRGPARSRGGRVHSDQGFFPEGFVNQGNVQPMTFELPASKQYRTGSTSSEASVEYKKHHAGFAVHGSYTDLLREREIDMTNTQGFQHPVFRRVRSLNESLLESGMRRGTEDIGSYESLLYPEPTVSSLSGETPLKVSKLRRFGGSFRKERSPTSTSTYSSASMNSTSFSQQQQQALGPDGGPLLQRVYSMPTFQEQRSRKSSGAQQPSYQTYPHKQREADLDLIPNKVFVGGLLYATGHESLRKFFEKFGAVHSAEVIYNRETKRSRGFGFVIFKEAKTVAEVLYRQKVNPLMIDEKQIEVKPCKAKECSETHQETNFKASLLQDHSLNNESLAHDMQCLNLEDTLHEEAPRGWFQRLEEEGELSHSFLGPVERYDVHPFLSSASQLNRSTERYENFNFDYGFKTGLPEISELSAE